MEDNQPHILQNNQLKPQITISQREQDAKFYYQHFKKHSFQNIKITPIEQYIEKYLKQDELPKIGELERIQSTELDTKNIKLQHSLIILQGLSQGKSISQIHRQNYIIQSYPINKLKNVPKLTLQKLSKIFVDLLPNNIIQLNSKQFYQKYFRTNQMLQFYKNNGLQLIPAFENLFFIKEWEKENKEYLKRGYSRDYIPEQIKNKLALLPPVYQAIKEMYDKYGGNLKTKQKRKFVKKSSLLIEQNPFQEDDFMKMQKAQSQ